MGDTTRAWLEHERQQRRAWLALSYQERLDWLSQAKRFAAQAVEAARQRRRSRQVITA